VVLKELKGFLQQSVANLNTNKSNISVFAVKLPASDASDDFCRENGKQNETSHYVTNFKQRMGKLPMYIG
jgi:hypothetical protein